MGGRGGKARSSALNLNRSQSQRSEVEVEREERALLSLPSMAGWLELLIMLDGGQVYGIKYTGFMLRVIFL